jgi:hypothetical protein
VIIKRYLVVAAILGAMLLLLWPRHGGNTNSSDIPEPPLPAVVSASYSNDSDVTVPKPEQAMVGGPKAVTSNQDDETERLLRFYNQGADTPIAFYGWVVDQDTNPLPSVAVDLAVTQLRQDRAGSLKENVIRFQRQTGSDGRFEVTGLKGNFLAIEALTKDGYEPELGTHYGIFGPQSTGFGNPAVLKLWSTNIHEPLIEGEKSFVLVPDGRHYAIDLLKGTLTEGNEGDLLIWINRPETVRPSERYGWSCEVIAPGGLFETELAAMFTAPEAGYTNAFAYKEEASVNGWGNLTGDKRFYVRLRNGQIYGRIVINLYAYYDRTRPAMIRLSYTVNPSGSRLLR